MAVLRFSSAAVLIAGLALAGQAAAGPIAHDKSARPRSSEDEIRPAEILNLRELVTADDYPAAAQMADEQGSVGVLVKVDEKGQVADCTVEQSSGSAALDSQTCRLFWLRAKFTPARDKANKPITSVYSRKITWRLEGDASPVVDWASKLVIQFKAGGEVDCRYTVEGALLNRDKRAAEKMTCEEMFGELPVLAASQQARGVQGTVLIEQRFTPGEHLPDSTPPAVAGKLLHWSVLHLKIAPDGRLSECTIARKQGEYPLPDPCQSVPKLFMRPMSKDGTPVEVDATMITTASGVMSVPSK